MKSINQDEWEQLVDDYDTFNEDFKRVFNDPGAPATNEPNTDTSNGKLNM